LLTVIFGIYVFSLAVILAYNFLQLNLLAHYVATGRRIPPPPIDRDNLPLVTVQLPLFNEPYVAERLIDNILALDYPRDGFEVQVLDDSTDATTAICEKRVAFYRDQGFDIKVIHRSNRSGYKAGALASGLPLAKGEFVAIFDADFLPNPQFLQKTLGYFRNPRVGVVQTRWTHLNED
jgi:cellulose synthase/poly-beta-1,6-N-acetylglucosamine synthase-like glycosyltransferase